VGGGEDERVENERVEEKWMEEEEIEINQWIGKN